MTGERDHLSINLQRAALGDVTESQKRVQAQPQEKMGLRLCEREPSHVASDVGSEEAAARPIYSRHLVVVVGGGRGRLWFGPCLW